MTNVTRTRILGVDQIPATREIKGRFFNSSIDTDYGDIAK
jgi:hypothetical protein